ncbi:hypothetical protein ACFQDD_01965 [Halorubrum pallidum]|uniref:Uncharacterized protein n=1 Tax=Halorubrum pallidum TaxID=1526114 RepID=A0ABD5T282_9EURY
MDPPQPAVDFLSSIATDVTAPEIPFGEWYAYDSIDADRTDDIRDYPGVWETDLELPHELRELSNDDHVLVREVDGPVNLNALALGIGLDTAQYRPERFSGLVYRGSPATTVIYGDHLCFAVGKTEQECTTAVESLIDEIDRVGLGDEIGFSDEGESGQVEAFLSSP